MSYLDLSRYELTYAQQSTVSSALRAGFNVRLRTGYASDTATVSFSSTSSKEVYLSSLRRAGVYVCSQAWSTNGVWEIEISLPKEVVPAYRPTLTITTGRQDARRARERDDTFIRDVAVCAAVVVVTVVVLAGVAAVIDRANGNKGE